MKFSKDLGDPGHPDRGRALSSGSWFSSVYHAESETRSFANVGQRTEFEGFNLVRVCP